MTPDDIDNQLAELSIRLERLRSLYEQYFMGIERIVPAIPHKDVERRVQQLRKTRFPTTAKRFKFQTVVQRYNSLQQYWTRSCREIENGTYRKHRKKAERRFASESVHPSARGEEQKRAELAAEAKDNASADLTALMDGGVDLDAERGNALAALEKSSPPVPNLDSIKIVEARPAGRGALNRRSPGLILSEAKAGVLPRGAARPKPEGSSVLRAFSNAPTPLEETGSKGSSVPVKLVGNHPASSQRSNLKSPSKTPEALKRKLLALKKSPEELRRVSAAAKSSTVTSRHSPPLKKGLAALDRVAVPAKKAAVPAKKAAVPAKKAVAVLSDARIRALHASYSDAREKTNARAVSFEKLSKSIRETEQKLRAKSKGRSVDFDVSIQGGKAILKPRLK